METGNAKYAREAVRLELAGRILADLLRLSGILGAEAAFRALAIPVPAVPGRVALSFSRRMPYNLRLEHIDVDRLPVGRTVMAMYGYAYEQHYPIGLPMFQFQNEMELVEDLVLHLSSFHFDLFLNDRLLMGQAADSDWKALPHLQMMAEARLRLDIGEELSLCDIVALSGMTDKSVRNALTATGEGQLRVRKEDAECIDNDEARRWLSLRRGFVPTHFEDLTAAAWEHPTSINSLFELATYIHQRWMALNKTPETVHQELEWPQARFDYLNAITGNPQDIDPRDCGDLARSLMVSESWFTAQVMRNLYPHQVELLLEREQQVKEEPKRMPPPMVTTERMCLRLRFVLHDGTELFPVRMKNRESGKVAFRLSKGGAGGNTIENTVEVEDENEMIQLVCRKENPMAVRLLSGDDKRQGLYRKGGRSVRNVELDGVAVI